MGGGRQTRTDHFLEAKGIREAELHQHVLLRLKDTAHRENAAPTGSIAQFGEEFDVAFREAVRTLNGVRLA